MQRTRFIKHGALFGILCVTAIGCGLERLGDVSTTNTSSGTTPTSTANPPTNEESEATDKTADDTSPNVSAASAASAMAKLMATAARPTTDFLSTGRIEIGLIPTNATGKLVRDGLAISADVSSHTQTAINLEQIHNSWLFKDTTAPSAHDAEECTEPDGQSGVSTSESVPEKPADPLHLAVVLDNSDCMQWTDPDFDRVGSIQMFIATLLARDPSGTVGVFDFGHAPHAVDAPFQVTRHLGAWSSQIPALQSSVEKTVDGGNGPMDQTFESLVEIMHHMHQQFPQAPRRAILLLADGQPSYDNAYGLSDAIAVANQYNIAICTIGVGPASELTWWPNSLYVHNMRQLAEQTGCVYSPASEIAALEPIFASLGEAFVEGQLVADLNIAPIPTSGETVTGAIHVTDALGVTQSAAFTFVAP